MYALIEPQSVHNILMRHKRREGQVLGVRTDGNGGWGKKCPCDLIVIVSRHFITKYMVWDMQKVFLCLLIVTLTGVCVCGEICI